MFKSVFRANHAQNENEAGHVVVNLTLSLFVKNGTIWPSLEYCDTKIFKLFTDCSIKVCLVYLEHFY